MNTENEINRYSFWDSGNIYILHFSVCCEYENVKVTTHSTFLCFTPSPGTNYLITLHVCIWLIASEIHPVWGFKFIHNCSYLMSLFSVCAVVYTWNVTGILNTRLFISP
jgi:hypothetical protein